MVFFVWFFVVVVVGLGLFVFFVLVFWGSEKGRKVGAGEGGVGTGKDECASGERRVFMFRYPVPLNRKGFVRRCSWLYGVR